MHFFNDLKGYELIDRFIKNDILRIVMIFCLEHVLGMGIFMTVLRVL